MRSRRSKAGDGWLPAPLFLAGAGAVLVSAKMYWPAVDGIGGRESSLALADATRVPANINIWNNRAVFIVSPRLTSQLRCGFVVGGFATSSKIGGQCSFFPPDLPVPSSPLIPPAISQNSKSKANRKLKRCWRKIAFRPWTRRRLLLHSGCGRGQVPKDAESTGREDNPLLISSRK
jgi:hypothetical protein